MKKVFLFFALATIFAACAPKATEQTVVVEEPVVVIEVEEVTDSVAIMDTTIVAE